MIVVMMRNGVQRIHDLDLLYTKIQAVTGLTVEQILDMFLAGYTLQPPEPSKLEDCIKEAEADQGSFVKVRCSKCGRLVTVHVRDKHCPLCKKKVKV